MRLHYLVKVSGCVCLSFASAFLTLHELEWLSSAVRCVEDEKDRLLLGCVIATNECVGAKAVQ